MHRVDVSVIIPCFNEEATIRRVVSAIAGELQIAGISYEVLVIDNGSTDKSAVEASAAGARVLNSTAPTVAGVRNRGVQCSKGRILVFLDADVQVLPGWGNAFRAAWLDVDIPHVGGAHCKVPDDIPPLLRSWFSGIEDDSRNTHLGTGHMIIAADRFEALGAFNPTIVTGEDYDFCARAKKAGLPVASDTGLEAVHLGYPGNIKDFFFRELWHGAGDAQDLGRFLQSRIAVAGVGFLFSIILLPIVAVASITLGLGFGFLIIGALMCVVLWKFGFQAPVMFARRTVVCAVYLLARGLAPMQMRRRQTPDQ